jgi:outer membrane lipopolysaccharide assembly protein LptE/RlpB
MVGITRESRILTTKAGTTRIQRRTISTAGTSHSGKLQVEKMRTPATFFLAVLSTSLALIGCGYDLVETKDLERLKTAEAEVSRLKEENSQLKQQVATLKSIGRYQLHDSGYRTWRLDTATGQDCLLLASKEDWKKIDIAVQQCPTQ